MKNSFAYRHSLKTLMRLSTISKLIQAGRINASELAARLHAGTRSIHRDISFLRNELGHQIDWDSRGYFYINPPPIVLGL